MTVLMHRLVAKYRLTPAEFHLTDPMMYQRAWNTTSEAKLSSLEYDCSSKKRLKLLWKAMYGWIDMFYMG